MLGRPTILVVDDELGPREAFRMILKEEYNVMSASSGPLALQFISREPVDVVILDIKMLGMDGIEVLREVKRQKPDVEVIMVTAYASLETAKEAIRYGAMDYLVKPFDRKEVEEVVKRGISRRMSFLKNQKVMEELKLTTEKLIDQIQGYRQKITDNYEQTIKALITAIDARDSYTKSHSDMVGAISGLLANQMGWSPEQVSTLEQAALIHDIGKIAVSEAILRKPASLTKKELQIMRQHPLIGVAIISPIELLRDIIPIVRSHHERFDGGGYPDGLKGEEIPEGARIVAVADAIVAMLKDRPYRKALALEEIRAELKENSGSQFDPKVVDAALGWLTTEEAKDRVTIPTLYKPKE
jgi:putative nucleotidyltransferase with HDIG domain